MSRATYRYAGKFSHRHDQRRELPYLSIELDAEQFVTLDWSLGGFRLNRALTHRELDDEVKLVFSGVRGETLYAGEVTVRIARIDRELGETGLKCVHYHNGAFDALESLMTGRKLKLQQLDAEGDHISGA